MKSKRQINEVYSRKEMTRQNVVQGEEFSAKRIFDLICLAIKIVFILFVKRFMFLLGFPNLRQFDLLIDVQRL